MKVLALALLLAAAGPGVAQILPSETGAEGSVTPRAEAAFRNWVQEFRPRALAAGIPAAVYDREMWAAVFLPDVLDRDRSQTEFTRTLWDYLETAVSPERLAAGRQALATHAAVLARIEGEYGVPQGVVAAIWGLESAYGTRRGDIDTISALATLAQDGRRSALFQGQLIHALRILAGGHVTRAAMQGSWAGAMGHTQFMPSSWAEFAVDFDADGRRDLWGDDPADALASAAHYLRQAGWQTGLPWGAEVRLPAGFDIGLTGPPQTRATADWAALGVQGIAGEALPRTDRAAILLPAGAGGPAFLITPNFHVIERYNRAEAYVIAIGHLADRLAGGGPVVAQWPRHWRALTQDERKELQQRLTAAGFDAGTADGVIGPNSIAALRRWQQARGRAADGYPSPDVLAALRAE